MTMKNAVRVLAAVMVAMALACGGGGGGDDSDDVQTPAGPTITVGSTVVAAGESATITAAVGDTLTIVGSEVIPQLRITGAPGKTCPTQWPNGLQSNTDTFTVKIGEGATGCIFRAGFDEGEATLVVEIPAS